ncbi:EamA family transporter [Comamonas flocculans]|uniref:EamA family transporter n=1 Tax=Comamonas flocculans TaxID=2597701 RepID=A0A5B8RWK8_9BURK|nr:EamA family transporter [Comamonas flocculans]QEA13966.1 EamA family transporter [Comamonas flocculans]
MSDARHFTRGDWARALAVVLIWGLNFVVMKLGLRELSPMLLGALRFSAASLPLLLFVRPPRGLRWRFVLGYGLAQGVGQFGLLFLGLRLGMTASMASVVMQMQVFFTLLAAPWLHERVRPAQWLGLAVAMAGLLAIAAAHGKGPGQMTLIGFILTTGASAMWAASNVIARRASQVCAYEPFPFIVWSGAVAVLPFFALAVWLDGAPSVLAQLRALTLASAGVVLYLALLATLLAYSLWTRLLQRHPAGEVAPFALMVPVVGLWAGVVLLGEAPSGMQWLGTVVVLAGLIVNQQPGLAWARRRQRRAAPPESR